MQTQRIAAFIFGLFLLPILSSGTGFVFAQSEIEQLQTQISTKNNRLTEIEAEIKRFESALQEVGAEKNTLQGAINGLEIERKKVSSDIKYTQTQISTTDLEINKLILEIDDAEEAIEQNENAIAAILQDIYINDNDSLIEVLLSHENLSEFWNEIESLETVKNSMTKQVHNLIALHNVLVGKKDDETDRRSELDSLRNEYSGQQAVLENTKAQKNQLLKDTKNEEANYQTLLQQQKEARDLLQREVSEIESKLQFILDPNSIPKAGTAVFNWPLRNIYITQYFGYTKFALAHQGVYKNNMHNGMDLGAPTGTKIHAPLTGTVRAVGNTDAVPGCYSWGQWILIDHPNGLSTLYAHLSHIGVAKGQKVATDEVIGFVGSTGYSTGSHLHFTLYVSDGVQVKQFKEFKAVTGCGAALSPFAAVEAYLDPLDYLPPV